MSVRWTPSGWLPACCARSRPRTRGWSCWCSVPVTRVTASFCRTSAGETKPEPGDESGRAPAHLAKLRLRLPRSVTAVEHQRVAVGIPEEGHVAHTGVEGVHVELHSTRLELSPCRRHV